MNWKCCQHSYKGTQAFCSTHTQTLTAKRKCSHANIHAAVLLSFGQNETSKDATKKFGSDHLHQKINISDHNCCCQLLPFVDDDNYVRWQFFKSYLLSIPLHESLFTMLTIANICWLILHTIGNLICYIFFLIFANNSIVVKWQ